MQTNLAIASECHRLICLLDEYPAGCDPEFDAEYEELDRQFAELRLQFSNQ